MYPIKRATEMRSGPITVISQARRPLVGHRHVGKIALIS
jgi:hypothetical protein